MAPLICLVLVTALLGVLVTPVARLLYVDKYGRIRRCSSANLVAIRVPKRDDARQCLRVMSARRAARPPLRKKLLRAFPG